MKTKLAVSTGILILVLVAIPRAVARAEASDASVSARATLARYEARISKIERRLEKIDAPIQQMAPQNSVAEQADEVANEMEDVTERLNMIRFLMSQSDSAPQKHLDLAKTELTVLDSDISEIESASSSLENEIDDVQWY